MNNLLFLNKKKLIYPVTLKVFPLPDTLFSCSGWNHEFILDDNVSSSEGEDSKDIFSRVQGQEDANLFNEDNHIVNNEAKYDDPFNIYGILNRPIKEVDKEKGISDDPSKPSGFTNVVKDVNNENSKGDTEVNGVECPRANYSVTQEGARSVEENHHLITHVDVGKHTGMMDLALKALTKLAQAVTSKE
ncbi:hypothetical protein Tco_1076874 [Tanacetum coccineum]